MVWTIRGYQKMISRYTPPTCKFEPSCSSYALLAFQNFGFFRGILLTSWRILRCNPLTTGGIDPLPRKKSKGHNGYN